MEEEMDLALQPKQSVPFGRTPLTRFLVKLKSRLAETIKVKVRGLVTNIQDSYGNISLVMDWIRFH